MSSSGTDSPSGRALRAAGYKPCPRWWLTDEQLDLVEYMARQNSDDVNRIRGDVRGSTKADKEK